MDNKEVLQELEKVMIKAALDGVLTQSAVDQFHAVLKQNAAQAEELRELQKVNSEIIDARDELSRKVKIMLDDANELSTRAAAIEEDEDEHRDRKVRLACAELRVQDHKEMFTTVFRNSVLRKEVMTPVSAGPVDQYGTKQPDSLPVRDTVEEEET